MMIKNLRTATIALVLALAASPVAADTTHHGVHVRVHVHAEAATTTNASSSNSTSEAFPNPVNGGLAVGESVSLDPENYTIADACKPQEWTVKQAKAASLQLHFAAIATAGHKLVVSMPNGSFAQEFSSESVLHDVTTKTIPGSSAKIAYQPMSTGGSCDSSQSSPSFNLDGVSVLWSQVKKESICGANTVRNPKCYGGEIYKKSRPVFLLARKLPDGKTSVCTAWLWGKTGLVITNNHCIGQQQDLNGAAFMIQREIACGADCTFQTCTVEFAIFGEVKLLKTDPVYDYSVLQIMKKSEVDEAVQKFGYLKLQRAPVKVGDQIYIPQHPNGNAKKIASSDDNAGSKFATITGVDYETKVGSKTAYDLIKYSADTDGGSSGSPVISRATNAVVGLHRIGGNCANAATPAVTLIEQFEMYLPGIDGIHG